MDGFLTAGAAALPLQDTTLVTLSACESGLGSTEKGEGCWESRALHSAGARHCSFSLWPVDDSATVESWMKRFYAGVFQGESPPKALRSAQAALLTDWSETRGLASAMAQAGGFVVTSMDVPP
ncbi:MAG: CHAT domain-containing protein [Verrucomicrobiales bacterium]